MLSVIKNCYQNENLTHADYDRILQKHQFINFNKNDVILTQSQSLNCYYILLNGCIHSYVTDANGNHITINLFTDHEVVIDVNALFQKKKTVENWQCLSNCTLLKISFDDFQELFHSIYGFREWGRTWMANELFTLKERSIEMLTLSATQRYEKLLTQKPKLFTQVPLKYIASYLGITDTSLSRIRKDLK